MNDQRAFSFSTVCAIMFFVTASLSAQHPMPDAAPSQPSVSVMGTSTVKCLPETIRIIITVQAKEKTVDEALKKLNAEKTAAVEKLQKLGFTKERLTFESMTLDQTQENRQRQMEAMVAGRMRQPGAKPSASSESVAIKTLLSAEWPLKAKTLEEILKEDFELKQKIKAADLTPEKEAMTPEEEELAEEMAMMSYGSDDSATNLEPRFLYVATISDERARAGYKEAFENAKKQAAIQTEAAGHTLGPLVMLSARVNKGQTRQNPYSHRSEDYFLMQMLHAQQYGEDESKQFENLSLQPEEMSFTFVSSAIFALERQVQ